MSGIHNNCSFGCDGSDCDDVVHLALERLIQGTDDWILTIIHRLKSNISNINIARLTRVINSLLIKHSPVAERIIRQCDSQLWNKIFQAFETYNCGHCKGDDNHTLLCNDSRYSGSFCVDIAKLFRHAASLQLSYTHFHQAVCRIQTAIKKIKASRTSSDRMLHRARVKLLSMFSLLSKRISLKKAMSMTPMELSCIIDKGVRLQVAIGCVIVLSVVDNAFWSLEHAADIQKIRTKLIHRIALLWHDNHIHTRVVARLRTYLSIVVRSDDENSSLVLQLPVIVKEITKNKDLLCFAKECGIASDWINKPMINYQICELGVVPSILTLLVEENTMDIVSGYLKNLKSETKTGIDVSSHLGKCNRLLKDICTSKNFMNLSLIKQQQQQEQQQLFDGNPHCKLSIQEINRIALCLGQGDETRMKDENDSTQQQHDIDIYSEITPRHKSPFPLLNECKIEDKQHLIQVISLTNSKEPQLQMLSTCNVFFGKFYLLHSEYINVVRDLEPLPMVIATIVLSDYLAIYCCLQDSFCSIDIIKMPISKSSCEKLLNQMMQSEHGSLATPLEYTELKNDYKLGHLYDEEGYELLEERMHKWHDLWTTTPS